MRNLIAILLCAFLSGCLTEALRFLSPLELENARNFYSTDVSFQCDPNNPLAEKPIRRLSKTQMVNTVRFMVNYFYSVTEATAILGVVDPLLDTLPDDAPDRDDGRVFKQMDDRFSSTHALALWTISEGLAKEMTQNASRLSMVAGACANTTPVTQACLDGFFAGAGQRFWSRPLSLQEKQDLSSLFFALPQDQWQGLLARVFVDLNFWHEADFHGTLASGTYQLDAYEKARQISYVFTDHPPDDTLFGMADSGAIDQTGGIAAALDHLYQNQLAAIKIKFWSFYEQWLSLRDTIQFDNSLAFQTYAAGVTATPQLYQEMRDELRTMTDYLTWDASENVQALFLNNQHFAQGTSLAGQVYNLPAYSGSGPGVNFSVSRPGIFQRAAAQVESGVEKNPIHGGVRFRQDILCDDLPSPPNDPNVLSQIQNFHIDPNKGTRESVRQATSSPQCIGCHTAINPVGALLIAGVDGLGRWRTNEYFYDLGGNQIASYPMRTSEKAHLFGLADQRVFSDYPSFIQAAVDSGKPQACLARQFHRFMRGRMEKPADGCALESFRQDLSKASLQDAIRMFAEASDTYLRKVGP